MFVFLYNKRIKGKITKLFSIFTLRSKISGELINLLKCFTKLRIWLS